MPVWVPPLPDKRPRLPGHPANRGGLRGRLAHDRPRRAREGNTHTHREREELIANSGLYTPCLRLMRDVYLPFQSVELLLGNPYQRAPTPV